MVQFFHDVQQFRYSFKPYYKWITFNIEGKLPVYDYTIYTGFKPYYKWITFNIVMFNQCRDEIISLHVLNLIING